MGSLDAGDRELARSIDRYVKGLSAADPSPSQGMVHDADRSKLPAGNMERGR